jgi:hypothetical protein
VALTPFDKLMALREQTLRTRVMTLEHAIRRFLTDGDKGRLERAYSNEWVQPLGDDNV